MADHGEVAYATATATTMPAHEATYENFVHLAYVGSCHVVSIVIGLAIGGDHDGHWLDGLRLIFVVATSYAIHRSGHRHQGAELSS